MPDPLELEGARCAVVPLMRARLALVDELVVERLPGLAAVTGPLDYLPVPSGGLRRVDAVRIGGGSFEVVNVPSGEMGSVDIPGSALFVRRQDERTLVRPDQYPYATHAFPSSHQTLLTNRRARRFYRPSAETGLRRLSSLSSSLSHPMTASRVHCSSCIASRVRIILTPSGTV